MMPANKNAKRALTSRHSWRVKYNDRCSQELNRRLFPGPINVESLTIPRSFSRILWLARPPFDRYKTSSAIDWFTLDVLLVVKPGLTRQTVVINWQFYSYGQYASGNIQCVATRSNNGNLYDSLKTVIFLTKIINILRDVTDGRIEKIARRWVRK